MATNLFSAYSTGENRVTASILAVLRSLEEIDDKGFRIDLQAFRMRVLRKLKPR